MLTDPARPSQVLYSGKGSAVGMRSGNVESGQWRPLVISKAVVRIVQCSAGHDGQHALMLTDGGRVFFVGAARRGEDGDTVMCEWDRRHALGRY